MIKHVKISQNCFLLSILIFTFFPNIASLHAEEIVNKKRENADSSKETPQDKIDREGHVPIEDIEETFASDKGHVPRDDKFRSKKKLGTQRKIE